MWTTLDVAPIRNRPGAYARLNHKLRQVSQHKKAGMSTYLLKSVGEARNTLLALSKNIYVHLTPNAVIQKWSNDDEVALLFTSFLHNSFF